MKKLLFILITASAFYSCKNNDAETENSNEDSLNSTSYYWQAYFNDTTGKLSLRKIPANDTLSPQNIAEFMNAANANIKFEYIRTSNDTIFIKIPDATYLTQQMGSTGPTWYLSELVYNMTEIPGIKEVNIDFEEGDHASPGTYNRTTFDRN